MKLFNWKNKNIKNINGTFFHFHSNIFFFFFWFCFSWHICSYLYVKGKEKEENRINLITPLAVFLYCLTTEN